MHFFSLFDVPVCDLCECPGHHADVPLWSSSGVPQVLRQDYPDGGITKTTSTAMCHLPRQNSSTEAEFWAVVASSFSFAVLDEVCVDPRTLGSRPRVSRGAISD